MNMYFVLYHDENKEKRIKVFNTLNEALAFKASVQKQNNLKCILLNDLEVWCYCTTASYK